MAGAFILLFGIISIKIKNKWFLGEACKPCLPPVAARPTTRTGLASRGRLV